MDVLSRAFESRGGVYPRPQTSANTAPGGDKPHPYKKRISFKPEDGA